MTGARTDMSNDAREAATSGPDDGGTRKWRWGKQSLFVKERELSECFLARQSRAGFGLTRPSSPTSHGPFLAHGIRGGPSRNLRRSFDLRAARMHLA